MVFGRTSISVMAIFRQPMFSNPAIDLNLAATSRRKRGILVKSLSRLGLVVVWLLAFTSTVWADPLFPTVKAATSANGKFMVTIEFEYLNPRQTVRTVKRVTYHVLEREEFINDKFTTKNPFWSDDWDVTLPEGQEIPSLPFISNDGKYLVLVSVEAPFSDATVLRIYREQRYGGEDSVRTYKLKDIWTADELKAHALLVSLGRPQWFAGSTLGFSADDSAFLVKMPWGREARLDLTGGANHAQ